MQKLIQKYLKKDYSYEVFSNIVTFPVLQEEIMAVCEDLYFVQKLSLKTILAKEENENSKIIYIFGVPGENVFIAPYIDVPSLGEFPSIANLIHEASIYERKIKTFFGLTPTGHPHLRSILLHENWPADQFPLKKDFDWNCRPEQAANSYEFAEIKGEGIYEIPVGPVHAGIIEPGHFRFSVAGEEIVNLEAKLGYTHKGSEKLFESLSLDNKVKLSERISGDSSYSHSLGFCQAVETVAGLEITERAKWLRVIFSELERLANHFGDIGFILMDTGYSFGGSNGQRLRELIMRWNEKLTGSRYLRGVNVIGGVTKDISSEIRAELKQSLEAILIDLLEVINIAEGESTVEARLVGTGKIDKNIAIDHGVVGIPARATGIDVDARRDYPYAAYDKIKFEIAQEEDGDVNARFKIRVKEVKTSIDIIIKALENMPEDGKIYSGGELVLKKNFYAVGITEGWRGEIVYFVATDNEGNISRVEVRDPSFLNWTVLGYAGKGNVVPDFPLINKSFNLSYSGNDL